MDRIHDGARTRLVKAVMRYQVKVHRTDRVGWAHQRNLLGLGQVAQIEKSEFSEPHQDSGGTRIFRFVHGPLWLGGAVRIRHWPDARNVTDVLTVGSQHDNVEPGNIDGVAGMDDAARLALNGFQDVYKRQLGRGGEWQR